MRTANIVRKTAETDITLTLCLDGKGESQIQTGCGFLDHMLTLFAKHGHFDLQVHCVGDTHVDYHHTVEDVGICLGKAFYQALGDKKGIHRYGSMILPMDESVMLSAVDISGRSGFYPILNIPSPKVGDFDTELCQEFWIAFARDAGITLHLQQLAGTNSHHIIEGAFKSVARSLAAAVKFDAEFANEVMSTKGVL
ncbi:MAG: imidazoleglycerol-phosphate dehydratase HisB [Oscillospiraceae bacterium]|nr:imidazoleglycerol-phosphate dehydratase HisB [Oscillospiraceae bacterium]